MPWTHEDYIAHRKDWNNSTVVGWKLWYVDGTFITSKDMLFDDAPQDGIAALIKYYKRSKGGYSREVQTGLDMYCLYSEQPLEIDLPPQIKKGENMPQLEWDALHAHIRACETQESEPVIGLLPEDDRGEVKM